MVGDSESEASWSEFFASLKHRGLAGVDLVVSDQHGGLVKSIRRHFQGATWQRCQTHFMRNILDATPKALKGEFHCRLRAVLDAPDRENARRLLDQVLEDFENRTPSAIEILENGFEDATAVFSLPPKYRRRLRTTNGLERLNVEVRRRERVIRIFPNRQSVVRLLGALLMEHDEQWSTGKRYLDMSKYYETRKLKPESENKVTLMR